PANQPKGVTFTVIGNRIIINTDDPKLMQDIQELIHMMTVAPGAGDFQVIQLKNANAVDAARVIDEYFNGPQPRGGFAGGRGGFPGFPGAAPQAAPTTTTATPSMRIVADPNANLLLVRASP